MNFHTMWGRPLQAFFVSSFFFCFSSKKEEATKRDPVVLLLHDLMLNAHANSNITRTQTLCPGLSGLNQPSEIDGPRTRVGISYRRPSDGHNNNIDIYDHDQGCRKFLNGWKRQFTFWGIFKPFWNKKDCNGQILEQQKLSLPYMRRPWSWRQWVY